MQMSIVPRASAGQSNPLASQGFSLIESAIILAVIGLIIGGIWVASAAITEARKSTRHVEQITQIINNAYNLWRGQEIPDPSSPGGQSILPEMIAAGLIPADAVMTASTAQNPWGGTLDVKLFSGSSKLTIATRTLPYTACVKVFAGLANAYHTKGNVSVITVVDDAQTLAAIIYTTPFTIPTTSPCFVGANSKIFIYINL